MPVTAPELDFLLFTTSDTLSKRDGELRRLLESIEQTINMHRIRVRLYLLMQNAKHGNVSVDAPPFVELLTCEGLVPLASARNMMMHAAREDGAFERASIVAFPDDDAWYPAGLLPFVLERFKERPGLTLFSSNTNLRTAASASTALARPVP